MSKPPTVILGNYDIIFNNFLSFERKSENRNKDRRKERRFKNGKLKKNPFLKPFNLRKYLNEKVLNEIRRPENYQSAVLFNYWRNLWVFFFCKTNCMLNLRSLSGQICQMLLTKHGRYKRNAAISANCLLLTPVTFIICIFGWIDVFIVTYL